MRWIVGLGIVLLLVAVSACAVEQQAIPLSEQQDGDVPPAAPSSPPEPSQPADNTSEPSDPIPLPSNSGANDTTTFENNEDLTCLDTDHEDDPFVKGVVQVKLPDRTLSKSDECLGSSVREWYCDKGELAKKVIECKYDCDDGACNTRFD